MQARQRALQRSARQGSGNGADSGAGVRQQPGRNVQRRIGLWAVMHSLPVSSGPSRCRWLHDESRNEGTGFDRPEMAMTSVY